MGPKGVRFDETKQFRTIHQLDPEEDP